MLQKISVIHLNPLLLIHFTFNQLCNGVCPKLHKCFIFRKRNEWLVLCESILQERNETKNGVCVSKHAHLFSQIHLQHPSYFVSWEWRQRRRVKDLWTNSLSSLDISIDSKDSLKVQGRLLRVCERKRGNAIENLQIIDKEENRERVERRGFVRGLQANLTDKKVRKPNSHDSLLTLGVALNLCSHPSSSPAHDSDPISIPKENVHFIPLFS